MPRAAMHPDEVKSRLAAITAENERLCEGNSSMEKEIPALRHEIERLTKERDEAVALLQQITPLKNSDIRLVIKLTTQRDAATARAERLEAELRKVEWGACDRSNAGPYCPCCKQFETKGHRSDCSLAAELEEPK